MRRDVKAVLVLGLLLGLACGLWRASLTDWLLAVVFLYVFVRPYPRL